MSHIAPNIELGETRDGLWVAAAAGRGRLSQICATVVRIDVEGHAYVEFAESMMPRMDQLVAELGHVYLGIDAEGMASYDARFRYLWTEWIKHNNAAIDGLLFLYRSRAVQSVAVIINAVTGSDLVEACGDRDNFEDRLAEAVLSCRSTTARV
ncbi:hypothetical protein ENSA5_40860 [Enhygromyxa salina]|uniref:STAS domain-containing protein n=1 Tax=Enhygromyxa salina TaxID=215803 RepID=A0A2S9XNL9_9BACT|nr:hypothetical protein [Enhygromyxa salina]PRP94467.1 hypothetical protein ENSA5_40860 [Enhygromyxa salina]